MSLTFSPVTGTNLLTVAFDGDLHSAEVTRLRAAVEDVVAEQGSVRILLEYAASGRISTSGMLQQLRTSSLAGSVDRAAIVTDVGWVRGAAATARVFVSFPVKVFTTEEHGTALEWVTE
jgi:hypothetical protein